VGHIALELQTLAGMTVEFGRTRETTDAGVYQVVFEYLDEQAVRYAMRAPSGCAKALSQQGSIRLLN